MKRFGIWGGLALVVGLAVAVLILWDRRPTADWDAREAEVRDLRDQLKQARATHDVLYDQWARTGLAGPAGDDFEYLLEEKDAQREMLARVVRRLGAWAKNAHGINIAIELIPPAELDMRQAEYRAMIDALEHRDPGEPLDD